MAGDLVISTINGGAIGTKNVIINGNFGINQRGVSGTVTLSAGDYGHDRFKAGASGCTYTFATSNNITTLTITAGSLMQVIEGINLQSGTYTLSWAGTAQGRVDGGSYAGSGLTGTAVGGTNQTVEFGTGTLSLVQYEAGSVATSFERRQYGQELALCQRYYYRNTGDCFGMGQCLSSTNAVIFIHFPTSMRTAPTALDTTGTGSDYRIAHTSTATTCNAVPTLSNATENVAQLVAYTAGSLPTGGVCRLIQQAGTPHLGFSAEL